MLPNDSLAPIAVPTEGFQFDNEVLVGNNFQYVEAGYGLQNPIDGVTGQIWRLKVYKNKYVYLQSLNYPETLIYTATGYISEASMAFDVSMNILWVITEDGETKLNWYDPVPVERVFLSLGSGIITPKLELDAKTGPLYAHADVLLGYVKESDGALYYRQQRDRFTIERKLHDGPYAGIARMGMNTGNRFQFKMIPLVQ